MSSNTAGVTSSERSHDNDVDKISVESKTENQNSAARFPIHSKSNVTEGSLVSKTRQDQALNGKQEHYLKRELVSEQVKWEISELNSPTALRRFGAPFRSSVGEVSPLDSELPILRYIFVHHVREFPFLDKAKEKEFWQDKLQVFLESFASKTISSSEDRLEETKRRKLALKCQKLVELMVVSGVGTSSGFEERVRFSELEIVDRDAIDTGVLSNIPEGHYINGIDVNVAGVRIVSQKRNIRQHKHAEFILRVKRKGELEYFVARRYSDFHRLQKRISHELPGKVLPIIPRKNKSDMQTSSNYLTIMGHGNSSDDSSTSSASTALTSMSQTNAQLAVRDHRRQGSSASGRTTPRSSVDGRLSAIMFSRKEPKDEAIVLPRETQRVSLRAFLRALLHNPQIAQTEAMDEFLTKDSIKLKDDDVEDIEHRRKIDEKRVEEQKQFYDIARKRAAELDVYMEQFRQEIVEQNGLTKLFEEVKEKESIQDLSLQYQKFAEWLRIEVAATIYHLFLAEDNSPELFEQAKRIHSLIPYTIIKNVIRITNPAAVMSSVLDVFLAQPFGSRSLMQRIFSTTLNEGIRSFQRSIDILAEKINDPIFVDKIKTYIDSEEHIKMGIREEASSEDIDLIVGILKTDLIESPLSDEQMGRVYNAYVAFNNAVENVDEDLKQGALLFSYLKQLLKLYTRQRDKAMMLSLIEEPVTLQLFRDLFTIFYEPLVRVYKSANVYSSVTDFSEFITDMIKVVEACRDRDASADPNETVQAFIDLCARHEHNFYKFVHEVHTHDNGLFTQLMEWIEDILEFLRHGPAGGTLDMNALFKGAVSTGVLNGEQAIKEVNELIAWQEARKKWHQDKTRQKMAAEGAGGSMDMLPGSATFKATDFGLDDMDLEDMSYDVDDSEEEEEEEEDEDDLDPIAAERRRRAKRQDRLRRNAGEPKKPEVTEVHKLKDTFLLMLRQVLAK